MFTTARVGETFPDPLHLGPELPLGSTLGDSYTHVAPGVWSHGQQILEGYQFNTHQMSLSELGDGTSEFALPAESEAAFRWRLRDAALSAAERSGVATRPVLAMAREFGAVNARLVPGGLVSSRVDLDLLPVGTVYYTAHPSRPDLLGVWEMTEHGHQRLVGNRERNSGQSVRLYSVPGCEQVPETPADPALLGTIALRAWRVGKVYKQRQNWCSVFENTLAQLGITTDSLAKIGTLNYGPGDVVDRERAVLLPEGTVLWRYWPRRGGFTVYVRNDRSRGKARTRRLLGFNDNGDPSAAEMTVVQLPGEEMIWSLSGSHLRMLPDGTEFSTHGGELRVLNDTARHDLLSYHSYAVRSLPRGWR